MYLDLDCIFGFGFYLRIMLVFGFRFASHGFVNTSDIISPVKLLDSWEIKKQRFELKLEYQILARNNRYAIPNSYQTSFSDRSGVYLQCHGVYTSATPQHMHCTCSKAALLWIWQIHRNILIYLSLHNKFHFHYTMPTVIQYIRDCQKTRFFKEFRDHLDYHSNWYE